MATFSYNLTDAKIETGTVTRTIDISELYDCVGVTPCAPCPPCILYKLPFIESDIFYFTMDFKIVNVRVKRIDGTLIGTYNAWKSNNILTINFADIPAIEKCFYIELERKDDTFCCFEFAFERVGIDCHSSTLLISSYYDDKDCNGNNYAGSYSNKVRIYALLEQISSETEIQKSEDKIISEKLRDVYQISFNREGFGLVPGTFFFKHFTRSVMRGYGKIVEHNGITYEFEKFESEITPAQNVVQDWYPVLKLKTPPCEIDFVCV